ncbi:Stc1 domain-containing protein [Aspergillus varians]
MGNRRVSGVLGAPNAFSGGFSEMIKRQLESVPLPDKVKCKTCKKYRNPNAYSKRQLDIFRNAAVVEGSRALKAGYAICRGCTGGQVMELRCSVCDQVKGLDDFAINQRKEHEFARCLDCVQGHKDAEPVIDENKLLTESELSTTQSTVIMSQVGSSLAGSTRRITPSDAPGSSFAGVTDNGPVGGGVWVEPERHDANSSKGRGLNLSSYDSYGPGNLADVDANSVHSGWALYDVQKSNGVVSVRSTEKDRKFAKVPAWRSEIPDKPPTRMPEVKGHVGDYDDDDEEQDVTGFL